jgi:hypothetical protein
MSRVVVVIVRGFRPPLRGPPDPNTTGRPESARVVPMSFFLEPSFFRLRVILDIMET